jgi:hypothetical protein
MSAMRGAFLLRGFADFFFRPALRLEVALSMTLGGGFSRKRCVAIAVIAGLSISDALLTQHLFDACVTLRYLPLVELPSRQRLRQGEQMLFAPCAK